MGANLTQLQDLHLARAAEADFVAQFNRCPHKTASGYGLLVKVKASSSKLRERAIERFQTYPMRAIREIRSLDIFAFSVESEPSLESIARQLYATKDYEWVRRDCVLKPASTLPNDPDYNLQWHLPKINAPQAWDITTGSSSVIIAVVDTGVEPTHEDLAGALVPGINIVDCSATATPGCGDSTPVATANACASHGTEVAGIAGAVGNNLKGITGIGWSFSLMSVRVTDALDCSTTLSNIAAGIVWASQNGAKVINVSFEGAYDPTFQAAADQARQNGSLVVFAAGNDTSDLTTLCESTYSTSTCLAADQKDLVIVGASTTTNTLAATSNSGAIMDLVAPGVAIETTFTSNSYGTDTGTSFAAPMVAGVAGLVWSLKPNYSVDEVKQILYESAHDLGTAGKDNTFGYGLVDAFAAVSLATSGTPLYNETDNGLVDFSFPRGPSAVLTAENQSRGSANSRLFVLSEPSSAFMTLEKSDISNRDLTFAELPRNLRVGSNSLFYMKNDSSNDFVFTDVGRNYVYYGSNNLENTQIYTGSCGPFQQVSALYLTEISGATSHLIVADQKANKVYSYTLTPSTTSICSSQQSFSITNPLWIRSIAGSNPSIYIGYSDSGGLEMQGLDDAAFGSLGSVINLTSNLRTSFGMPYSDPTSNDLYVPLKNAYDTHGASYIRHFLSDFSSSTTFQTCADPVRVFNDFEGVSRYHYVFCPGAGSIQVFDLTDTLVKTLSAGSWPVTMLVGSNGSVRYASVLEGNNSVLTNQVAVGGAAWTSASLSLSVPMSDMAHFGLLDEGVLVDAGSNTISFSDPIGGSLLDTWHLPTSIDSIAAESSFVSHFISSNANTAYTLEELALGTWKLRFYDVGTSPQQIGYRSTRLYVANKGSNNLSVINLASRVVTNLSTDIGPVQFDFNTTKNKLWVMNSGGNSLTTVDITLGSEAAGANTSLGFSPQKVVYQSSNDTLYAIGGTSAIALDGTSLATLATGSISGGVTDIQPITGGAWISSLSGLSTYTAARTGFTLASLTSSPHLLTSNRSIGVTGLENSQSILTSGSVASVGGSFSHLFSSLTNLYLYLPIQQILQVTPYSLLTSANLPSIRIPLKIDPQQTSYDTNADIWMADSTKLEIQRVDANYQMKLLSNLASNFPIDITAWSAVDRVYILLATINALAVVNTVTGSVSYHSVCQNPKRELIDTAHSQVYVICPHSNALVAVALDSNGDYLSQRLLVSDMFPTSMALNVSLSKLYVANQQSSDVLIYNSATNALITRAVVSTSPSSVVVNSTTNVAYVFDATTTLLSSINGVSNAVSSTDISLNAFTESAFNTSSSQMYALAPSSAGLYFDRTSLNFTPNNHIVGKIFYPEHLAVSPAVKKTYVTFPYDNVVRILNETASTSSDVSVGNTPYGIMPDDTDAKTFVTNFKDNSVSVLNETTDAISSTLALTAGCGPTKMTTSTVSNVLYVYVLCQSNDTVVPIRGSNNAIGTPISLKLP